MTEHKPSPIVLSHFLLASVWILILPAFTQAQLQICACEPAAESTCLLYTTGTEPNLLCEIVNCSTHFHCAPNSATTCFVEISDVQSLSLIGTPTGNADQPCQETIVSRTIVSDVNAGSPTPLPCSPSMSGSLSSTPTLRGNRFSAMAPNRKYAYSFGYESNALRVYDISDPNNVVIGATHSLGPSFYIDTLGNDHIISSWVNTTCPVRIWDVSDPLTSVTQAAQVCTGTVTTGHVLKLRGEHLYSTTSDGELYIIDMTSPLSPTILSHLNMGINGQTGMEVTDDFLYIVNGGTNNQLFIVDIRDKTSPFTAAMLSNSDNSLLSSPSSVFADEPYVYVFTQSGTYLTIDVTTPTSPSIIQAVNSTATRFRSGEKVGNEIYVGALLNGVAHVFHFSVAGNTISEVASVALPNAGTSHINDVNVIGDLMFYLGASSPDESGVLSLSCV